MVGVLGGALLLAGSRQGLWYDETYTAGVIGRRGAGFWSEIVANDKGFAPYYVLVKVWSLAFGDGDLALRSSSIAAHVVAAGMFWVLVRRRLGLMPAVAGTAVLAGGLMLLQMSVTARPYALVTLGCTALLWLGMRVLDRARTGARTSWSWGGVVVVAAGLPWLTPLAGIGAAIAIVAPVAWTLRRDRRAVLLGLPVIGVSWMANIWAVRTTPADPHPGPLISVSWLVDAGSLALGGGWLAPILAVLVVTSLVALWRGWSAGDADGRRSFGVLVISLLLVPGLLTVALGTVGQQVYPRYVVGSAVGVAGCCSWAVAQVRWARWLVVPLVVVVLAQAVLVFWPLPTGHRDDWREATRTVAARVGDADGLMTPSPQLRIPLSWYGRHLDPVALGQMVWPPEPLSESTPSRDYTRPPFRGGDELPASLPRTVWMLVLPGESTAADAARRALGGRGFHLTSTTSVWVDPLAPSLLLERFESSSAP